MRNSFDRFLCLFVFIFSITVKPSCQDNSLMYLLNLNDSMHSEIRRISSIRKDNRTHQLYLNPTWQHSILETKKGQILHFNGRYSVLDNAVQWRYDDQIGNIHFAHAKSILVGPNLLVPFHKTDVEGAKRNVFLEVLVAGKLNLYIHHFLDSKMSGSNSITSTFNGTKEYFLAQRLMYSEAKGPVKNLKTRKKKMLVLFGDKRTEVESYVADNHLRYNDQEDLIKIFSFFNQLPVETYESSSN